MEEKTADLVVLGAGPGGYVAAIRGAQLGLETLVVENGQVGGVCLNWGCIPSKALIQAADTFHRLGREVPAMGIEVGEATVDMGRLQDWKDGIVHKLTQGVRGLFRGNGIELVEGKGRLVATDVVEVATPESTIRVRARRGVILATGARPIEIPALPTDGERIISAKAAVSLREVPERLAVIGGGVIGLELGTVYRKLGSEVTVVELMPAVLPGLDPDIVTACARRLKQLKIAVLTGAMAQSVEKLEGGPLRLTVSRGEEVHQIEVDTVLLAVGMRPYTDDLGLKEVGGQVDPRGHVPVDARCATNVEGIYAIGDLTGPPMLAHKASYEGEVAAEAIAGHGDRSRVTPIPSAVFTDPEIGSVGLTEPQARETGREIQVGRFYFAASGKAMALQETQGFAKVIADRPSGRILGIHVIGPHASDLLAEATLAVERGLTVQEFTRVVRAHPTLAEVLLEAALAVEGHAIHVVRR